MDNTIIRDLFARDLNRSINGVVKVQDSKDGSIRQELEIGRASCRERV